MPYLKTPRDVAVNIGATTGSNQSPTDSKFIAMLDDVHAHIENSLNVPSLALAGYTDKFDLDARFIHNCETFRLKAGFVDPASLVVTDPSGDPVTSDRITLDAELGVFMLDQPRNGRYTVQYNAGFAAAEGDVSVYVGTPSWLRALVERPAVEWFRTVSFTAKAQENVSFEQTMAPIYRGISSTIYGRYQRPRARVLFPVVSVASAPHEAA